VKAETASLVETARERYEDALACEAIRRFLTKVTDVPDFAWGKFEWSRRWATDWATATEARLREAATARDVQEQTGSVLFQVAASYEQTDITAAYNIDVTSDSGVLRGFMPESGAVTARPGGVAPPPGYPEDGYRGRPPQENPANPSDIGSRLHYLALDHYWNRPDFSNPGIGTDMDRCRAALGNTPGRAALSTFVNEHHSVIQEAQDYLRSHGIQPQRPPTDMFDDAMAAVPGIIDNRAELLAVAGNGYTEMAIDMATDTSNLLAEWSVSDGAAAYELHAKNCVSYFTSLATEANWFHTEGKKAARTIDNLMRAYAGIGYERINGIINRLAAAKDAANDLTDSIDEPLKALAAAVDGLVGLMLEAWRAANEEARATLEVNKQAGTDAPQLGTVSHSARPFPGEHGVRNNRWRDFRTW
jgi:hypothetical protein